MATQSRKVVFQMRCILVAFSVTTCPSIMPMRRTSLLPLLLLLLSAAPARSSDLHAEDLSINWTGLQQPSQGLGSWTRLEIQGSAPNFSVGAFAGGDLSDGEAIAVAANARTISDLLERAKEIKFEAATSKIAPAAMPFLDELAAALVREPGVRLEILSHTGDSGDAKKDLALSKRRAEAVKGALVGKGASADQLVATGRGSEDPISPNITRSGRMRNERVELHRAGTR
jgi:outer membrane protein OmpA-like peptidoglycan-associated protein